jgi:hypothetical protein
MTMPNFFRDVLLPGTAAVGLLLAFAVGPAKAHEQSSTSTADATLAANAPRSTLLRRDLPEPDARGEYEAEAREQADSGIEPGCDRVRRIGKFTLTRCD